ncbi:MAG: hypothetical protein HeimAB125_17840 [Candidatus Heimdallarchaeota archaeon AB_125]|nr:MAG: hypothetical protein HeimAB125_17840 [Candidatus Heimdallarchaeota archaeon AB_125]
MPATPLHFGFAIFLFSILPFMDPIALLIGVAIIDLEPFFYMITGIGQLHGIMHSILGMLVFFIPTTFISWSCYKLFKLERYLPKFKIYISLLSGIVGLFSHVFFDGILYPEIMFVYPFSKQAGMLYNIIPSSAVYWILVIMLFVGIAILVLRYYLKLLWKKREETNPTLLEGRINI